MKKNRAVAIIVILILLQFIWYYRGIYIAPPTESLRLDEISVTEIYPRPFADKYEVGDGTVIFDLGLNSTRHSFELTPLLNRLTSRGFSYEFMEGREELSEKLKYASSLAVISPKPAFKTGEVKEIKRFIDRGGRLLLISDPERADSINSLSSGFGIIFEGGYLYNMHVHEGNFRNIYLREFAESNVTEGLKKVVLYSSCPITGLEGIMFGDGDTHYSRGEGGRRYSPAVMGDGILAICDLTFLTEPYSALEDNPLLVSNIADFLTQGKRAYLLENFPYFLDEEVGVSYASASLLEQAFKMREILDRDVALGAEEDTSKDAVILGLYDNYVELSSHLDHGNITIEGGMLSVPGIGEFESEETAFAYLYEDGKRRVMIIMADSAENLTAMLKLMEEGELGSIIVNERIAITLPSAAETQEGSNSPAKGVIQPEKNGEDT